MNEPGIRIRIRIMEIYPGGKTVERNGMDLEGHIRMRGGRTGILIFKQQAQSASEARRFQVFSPATLGIIIIKALVQVISTMLYTSLYTTILRYFSFYFILFFCSVFSFVDINVIYEKRNTHIINL